MELIVVFMSLRIPKAGLSTFMYDFFTHQPNFLFHSIFLYVFKKKTCFYVLQLLNCLRLFQERLFDEFVLAHIFGWWGKAIMIRNQPLLWVLSIGFELMEVGFHTLQGITNIYYGFLL